MFYLYKQISMSCLSLDGFYTFDSFVLDGNA